MIAGYLVFIPFSILLANAAIYQESEAPDQRFGVAEAFWAPEDARELGVGWERILFYWKEIQPEGPDDWNTLHVREEWLAEAEQSGREVVGLLKNTALWASQDGTEASLPVGLYLPVDDPNNYWANFARRAAQYYAPRNVHNWIIWNEPEISSDTYGYEFAGSVEDYYQLLKVAYQVIKEEDPEATIHLAGVTWWHDQSFLRRLFDVAVSDPEGSENDWFFDVVSLHIYFRPETVLSIVQDVQALLREYDLDKKIWLNETNAPPNMDPEWPVERPAFNVDLEQQAWFLIQSTALSLAAGAERVAAYKLIDVMLPEGGESFGLIRQDSSQRPAFKAYETTIDYLSGFDEVSLKEHPHYYVATFVNQTRVTRIAWTRTTQGVALQLPALAKEATVANYTGDTASVIEDDGVYQLALSPAVCHGECLIGGPPLFIVEKVLSIDVEQIETAVAIAGAQLTPPSFSTATRYPSPTSTRTSTPVSTTAPSRTSTATATMKPTASHDTATPHALEQTMTLQAEDVVSELAAGSSQSKTATPTALSENSGEDEPRAAPDEQRGYGGLVLLGAALVISILLAVYLIVNNLSHKNIEE
jgi:hypothetical protein